MPKSDRTFKSWERTELRIIASTKVSEVPNPVFLMTAFTQEDPFDPERVHGEPTPLTAGTRFKLKCASLNELCFVIEFQNGWCLPWLDWESRTGCLTLESCVLWEAIAQSLLQSQFEFSALPMRLHLGSLPAMRGGQISPASSMDSFQGWTERRMK